MMGEETSPCRGLGTRSNIVDHLRCTISGGLEDLAIDELQRAFSEPRLFWIQKGNSGSQLGLEVTQHNNNAVNGSTLIISDAIRKLRFVEYVHFVVHSQEYSLEGRTPARVPDGTSVGTDNSDCEIIENLEEGLLSRIESDLLSSMESEQLQRATEISRSIQDALRNRSVGLEPLAGELLPTPAIDEAAMNGGNDTREDIVDVKDGPFLVNTIYTRPAVAKVVVQTFVQLVQKYSPSAPSHSSKLLWLDAGAGSGALLHHLPSEYRLGIDISPARTSCFESAHIVQANFLETTPDFLREHFSVTDHEDETTLCVISNPPFADRSRGDYSAIIQFLNHSTRVLNAQFVGLIVPANFARPRIWASLGMDSEVRLLARFFLPQNSFVDPSSQKLVHIHSYFLLFGVEQKRPVGTSLSSSAKEDNDQSSSEPKTIIASTKIQNSFYLRGKRDKGDFPGIATASLIRATVLGLTAPGKAASTCDPLRLVSEREAEFPLLVKLQKSSKGAKLELWLLLNPERPCSLINSVSSHVSQHSLGWMSTSVKPAVAHAMLQSTVTPNCALIIDAMSGEGTIALEAQHYPTKSGPFFLIAGDKSEAAAQQTAKRLSELERKTENPVLVDLVVWDAQRLPIRRDVADVFLADLPFAGSQRIKHQVPSSHSSSNPGHGDVVLPLNYRSILAQAVRIMRPLGEAALISADTKALVHSTGKFHWRSIPAKGINRINLGGLNAQLLVMKKLEPCGKDASVWVAPGTVDLSTHLLAEARQSVSSFYLDDVLELQTRESNDRPCDCPSLVTNVKLVDEYYHEKSGRLSHCYRIILDGLLTNLEAKRLEKLIRATIGASSALDGVTGMR